MATAVIFLQRAPFVLYLSSLPAFATACSFKHTPKKLLLSVHRLSSLGYYYLFFSSLDSEMNDKKKEKKNESMCPETRERGKRGREKENARRTFFFCLLSKCSIRLFFSPSVRVKKKVERGEELCSIVVTPFFLSAFYIYVRVFVFFTLSLFFFCIYTRIWRLQTYINARKDRKEGKNLYEAENEWKTHELVSALARSRARSLSLSQY